MNSKDFLKCFIPNTATGKRVAQTLFGTQIVILVLLWLRARSVFVPGPADLASAFQDLWYNDALALNILASLWLNMQAILWATVLTMLLAWASTTQFFRPWIEVVGKLRFLSMVGFTFYVKLLTHNGHQLKLTIIVWAIAVFYVTSMSDILLTIPREQFDLARVMHMGPWQTLYEVVILGQADKALDALRQNVAMGWQMLVFVESFSREDGGIGTLLSTENKYFNLAGVMAIQLVILAFGLLQDALLKSLKRVLCPYSFLVIEKR